VPYDLPDEKPAVITVASKLPQQEIEAAEEKTPVVERTLLEKWCEAVQGIQANDAGKIGSTIDNALKAFISDDDKQKFAKAVKDHMGGAFKGSKAKEKLKIYLQ
jgi:hypothetical protein